MWIGLHRGMTCPTLVSDYQRHAFQSAGGRILRRATSTEIAEQKKARDELEHKTPELVAAPIDDPTTPNPDALEVLEQPAAPARRGRPKGSKTKRGADGGDASIKERLR